MKKMGKLFLTGCFSLAMAAAFTAIPVTADAEEKLKEGERLNSPFSRQMTFMVIWMTSSR